MSRIDRAFRRFQGEGDPEALAFVFDRAAPELARLAAHLVPAAGVPNWPLVGASTLVRGCSGHRPLRPRSRTPPLQRWMPAPRSSPYASPWPCSQATTSAPKPQTSAICFCTSAGSNTIAGS